MDATKPFVFRWSLSSALVGYAACIWALIFGGVHVYWALGGTAGLQGHQMNELIYTINLVAIPLCFVAAFVAFALVESWNRLVPHRIWLTAAWGASLILAARGTVGVLQSVLSQDQVPLLLVAYDAWFLLGGILFGVIAIWNH